MRKYLVVSYSEDSLTFYYDNILAKDADAAKAKVLKVREDCLDADAIPVDELGDMARTLDGMPCRMVQADWASFVRERKS